MSGTRSAALPCMLLLVWDTTSVWLCYYYKEPTPMLPVYVRRTSSIRVQTSPHTCTRELTFSTCHGPLPCRDGSTHVNQNMFLTTDISQSHIINIYEILSMPLILYLSGPKGPTALHAAARFSHTVVLSLLLMHGADPFTCDSRTSKLPTLFLPF